MANFQLSQNEQRLSLSRVATSLGWLALMALVIVTGVHAVSLTIDYIGFDGGLMAVIRVGSPILVEVIAAIVAAGFAAHAWRGTQRLIGSVIEVGWLLFAALNLLTSFTTESGSALPAALAGWLTYGLPVSALLIGSAFYLLLRVSPDHMRETERKATTEAHIMAEFAAQQEVLGSPYMQRVLRQRGWLMVIADLERQGYTAEQIRFMLAGVPQLEQLTGGGGEAVSAETSSAATGQAQPGQREPAFFVPRVNGR